ncbi:RNI-like protein [Aaosphaeria arxii CBS 175.79]|uniref:RNI-like protein n=1 Tax=Aaosphaeria arxii CBS 175.79 TaxID=1450172 RepID=A0A6A5XQ22_9PLEO|nr:RNI-like protein [Aaosphaeria arxii CBS 175.79]KAF2014937.1 RNI-like protein [Aaosphaeria arxii CBS 175.79]
MEDIHGVDVSWLHHSNRDHHHRQRAPSSPGLTRDAPPRTSAHGGIPHEAPNTNGHPIEIAHPSPKHPSSPPPSSPPPSSAKTPIKRPTILSRGSSEKPGSTTPPDKTSLRRGSWISSISSKFSSQNSPAQTTHTQAQGSPATPNGAPGTTSSANGALNGIQQAAGVNHVGHEPYVPQQPKGSFISNALRRLSSGSQVPMGKAACQGGVCPRRVLNVDRNRDRCLVPELDQSKLRRVAFCVDVEIAGGPRYKDDVDNDEKKKLRKDKKLKERAEGEALKHPETVAAEKEQNGAVTVNGLQDKDIVGTDDKPSVEVTPAVEEDKKDSTKKKEKKKRSEAERKERKEKKRRKAEENGTVPLELTREDSDDASDDKVADVPEKKPSRPQDRPTIDPLRIYRRCCQLRETPILKRISDQLANPKSCAAATPGIVSCLNLTGSRLQLADIHTLSDWLAVVPVKKLFLEDADLNDEKVRVILAGLLAAKVPEGPKRRSSQDKVAKDGQGKTEDRPGVVKKLTLNNNPKIGPEGWRHISLFLYMCKSIEALDVSMIPFPKARPHISHQNTNSSQTSTASGPTTLPPKDVADTFAKAISERLGGSTLEELVMAECSLTTPTIRKIVDGVVMSGVKRLGLAGNDLDKEGFSHVFHYIKSGVCHGLDLGGNDLSEEIGRLAESLTKDNSIWALSLADCNLSPESLKILFPALVALPDFKFLDLSHNKDLLSHQTSLFLLRKHLPQIKNLKRLHLVDVSLSTEHAIGLAEIIPECSQLAHVNILENPAITAVAKATDESTQEEAVALYASLAVAAKVSKVLVCIDVDVPAPESSELVKAVAKQVVAYCLKNMEAITEIPELKSTAEEVPLPDVLMHLIGHADGTNTVDDKTPAAPDEDYIIGGTGVVKALSYCLIQKATDLRRHSLPASGTHTPGKSAEQLEEAGKAKMMSKNLLESARNIRERVQPALFREARSGNDMAYRRLLFLDQTLQGMIQRFEDEYPETRILPTDASSSHSSEPSNSPPASSVPTLSASVGDMTIADSDEDEPKALRSRHNSDVSLASRAQILEEGQLHRFSHRVRTEIMNPSRPSSSHSDQAMMSGSMDNDGLPDHLVAIREQFFNYSGQELKDMIQGVGFTKAFDQIVENAEQLKQLQKENPEEFRLFRESQIAALKNTNPDIHFDANDDSNDVAVED